MKVMTPLWGTKTPSAPVGAKSGGDRRAARSLLSCALWRGIGRLWRGMGGRRPQRRQHGLLGFTSRATCFSPALWRLQGEQPQARPTGFHETRDTRHESRTLPPPGRCFPARCGAAWGGYGAAWATAVPRAGNKACWVFTSHESRNTALLC